MQWLFVQGGILMYPLALCSVAALTFMLERACFWIGERRKFDAEEMAKFLQLIRAKELREARAMAALSANPILARLSHVLPVGSEKIINDSVDLEINAAEDRANRYLRALNTVVTVSPLLGIMGTVFGIIASFFLLHEAMISDPQLVGSGLAEALITTAAGLTIAVPALLAYNFFTSLSSRHIRRLETFGEELEIAMDLAHASAQPHLALGSDPKPVRSERSPAEGSRPVQAAPLRGAA